MNFIARVTLPITFHLLACTAFAQNVRVSGYVLDALSKESIINATLTQANNRTATNQYGFFSLSVKANSTLSVRYIGCDSATIKINTTDTLLKVYLQPNVILKEVVILSEEKNINTPIGIQKVNIAQLKKIPAVGGEADVLKSIQKLPGVQSGVEGTAQTIVRGGSPDQNLILVDDIPIYNVNHLFGYFSIFPAEAVKNIDLYKSSFPAKYGGRLSSVIDIKLKEGNKTNFKKLINVSPVSIQGSIEGPIIKDKSSFMVTGRRTWYDLLYYPILKLKGNKGMVALNFYDLTAKLNYSINDKHKIYLSFYNGKDGYGATTKNKIDNDSVKINTHAANGLKWGNSAAAFRHNYTPAEKTFINTTLGYSNYHFTTYSVAEMAVYNKLNASDKQSNYSLTYRSAIADLFCKTDAETHISNTIQLHYGMGASYKINTPGLTIAVGKNNLNTLDTTLGNKPYTGMENHAYLQAMYTPSSQLKINAGLRAENYIQEKYNPFFIQPRVNVLLQMSHRTALKMGYSLMNQNIHLLTNSGTGLPTDLWLPATAIAPSEASHQMSVGISKDFHPDYELSIETYYKTFDNLIDYKEGASYLNTFTSWENKIEIGKGTSYGAEIFLHKKQGKCNGWVSYTLSYTQRQFQEINYGKSFPYRYDRRHVANIVLNYEIKKADKKTTELSISWSYLSGQAVTLPTKLYDYSVPPDDHLFYYLSSSSIFEDAYAPAAYGIANAPSKNNYRMRAAHHLDVSYSITKTKKWGERKTIFSIYNIYARQNPYFIYAGRSVGSFAFKSGYFEKSILLFIPSIAVQYKF
jgi:hypothetical protein